MVLARGRVFLRLRIATDDVKLSYATARKMDIEGTGEIAILARLCLDARGVPVSATIVEGSDTNKLINQCAVRAEIMTWEYEPHTADGKPVPFRELLTFRILLQDSLG